jgi:DNA-binding NtrC family response regulator
MGHTATEALDLAFQDLLGLCGFFSHFQLINGSTANRVTGALCVHWGAVVDSPSQTVLVVDDDSSIRFLCRVNLELDGWGVREAATIEQARAELAAGSVDIVLLDVHLGTVSGVEFLEELRADYPSLPVAMVTGTIGSPTLRGVTTDGVIPKPFTLEQLTGTVRKLAARISQRSG